MMKPGYLLTCLVIGLMIATATLLPNTASAEPNGPGLFIESSQYLGTTFSYAVGLGDVDSDGDLDAYIAKSGANEVWLNNGTAVFSNSNQFLGTSTSYGLALGDLNNDTHLDAFIANRDSFGGAPDKVWLNNGTGQFNVTTDSLGTQSSYGVALGDIDLDNDLDAFVAACGNPIYNLDNANKLWLNDGTGSFTDSGLDLGTLCSTAVAIADLNHDGKADVVVANAGSPNPPILSRGVEIWLNFTEGPTATLTLSKTQVIDEMTYNQGVAIGDLNNDNHPDIFVANNEGTGVQPNHILLNDGTGQFTDSGHLLGSAASNAAVLGDFNLDGYLDALAGNGNYDTPLPNMVWFNEAAFIFTSEALTESYTLGVAVGDLDDDADLDLFIATDQADQIWLNRLNIVFDHTTYLPLLMSP